MDFKQLIGHLERLNYGVSRPVTILEREVCGLAARRLALAEELIDNLVQHDGAEGFSESTYKLLDKWYDNP